MFTDVLAFIYLNKTPTDTLQRILIIKLIMMNERLALYSGR